MIMSYTRRSDRHATRLMMSVTQLSLFFTAPKEVAIREAPVPSPAPGEVLVMTLYSAISPGTESLIYRGLFPEELAVDEHIPPLSGKFAYPLKYGYSTVGRVIQVGEGVHPAWEGRMVFAFNPHESHFTTTPELLLPLPEDITLEDAVFLPNMETAVNLVMDGKPAIGERLLVFGQGIIGLLTTALLARFPLEKLITLDCHELRRKASLELGAHESLNPDEPGTRRKLKAMLPEGADLAYEISGVPLALDQAISLTGFSGRVVIGSWYGQKQTQLDLGGRFHRSRIRLISSQVSTLAPELSGLWNKARRFALAWDMLRLVKPGRFITHRFPIQDAGQAYRLIDECPAQTIQVIFTYP